MTAQQKEALASQTRSPHTIQFAALQQRWRCTTHRGRFCYKRHDNIRDVDHAPLDTTALSDWATAIVNETADVDVDHPPSTEEWDEIIYPPPKRHKSGSFEARLPYQLPDIHMHYSDRTPRRSPRYHSSRRSPHRSPYPTPRATARPGELLISSPILVEHPSWAEYEGDGLKAFIAHCESKYRVTTNTAFQEAYLKLCDHEIQPDIMRGKTVEWYEAKGIKSGTAERIVLLFNKWYAKMQQDTA